MVINLTCDGHQSHVRWSSVSREMVVSLSCDGRQSPRVLVV